MNARPLDLVCLGRSSVDLYGEQVGGRLEDMQTFAKYVGGCPTNISVGTARLGLRSALITRVGDEQMGRFIRETLNAEGVDTSRISTDPKRLTALVILGIRDRNTFPHIFYRENCADMAISAEDIDPGFIASSAALLVSGTHFSTPGVDAASRTAIRHARTAGTRVVFDIDYRPVLWGLIGHAEGEARFVTSASVTEHLQSILPDCDLVVGTEEEVHIAGGSTDTLEAVRRIRERTAAAIVLKRGALGCVVFPDTIPDTIDDGIVGRGDPVEVFNTLGAGDGFMSGFLRGWLRDLSWERCCAYANATGALVVSRHGCAPAMPSWEELRGFLDRPADAGPPGDDRRLNRLHRVTTRRREWEEVHALAFDHRVQFEELADRNGVDHTRIAVFKRLVAEGAAAVRDTSGRGAIVDDRYGDAVLASLTGEGWWLARPVEVPKSVPVAFEPGPNIGLALRAWPEEHIAKCLVAYHPDHDAALRREQEDRLLTLFEACAATGHELLVEVIPPDSLASDGTTLPRALTALYARGIFPDWWKLPPATDPATWDAIASVIETHDRYCRGIVVLGLDAPEEELKRSFEAVANQPLCKGFAVGRSIFREAAEAWFAGTSNDEDVIAAVAKNYRRIIQIWRSRADANTYIAG